jgi:entericidin B
LVGCDAKGTVGAAQYNWNRAGTNPDIRRYLVEFNNRRAPMKPTFLSALLFSILAIAGCETVQGAGQDLSNAGSAIAQESREVQAAN